MNWNWSKIESRPEWLLLAPETCSEITSCAARAEIHPRHHLGSTSHSVLKFLQPSDALIHLQPPTIIHSQGSKFIWSHEEKSLALACITLFRVSLIRTGLRAAKSFFCFCGVLATIFGISEEWNQAHTRWVSRIFLRNNLSNLYLVPTQPKIGSESLSLTHSHSLSLIGRHFTKPFCFWLQSLAPKWCWHPTNTNSV